MNSINSILHIKENQNVKDILKVTLSNFATILSSVLVGFMLPKILGVNDYGMFRTFTLYITYTSLLSFGFSEGIYLKYGGYSIEELDKEKFRFFTKTYICSQIVISLVFVLLAYFSLSGELRRIGIFVSIFIYCGNINQYYVFVSQITKRFGELSHRNVLRAISISSVILVFFALKHYTNLEIRYYHYTIIFLIIYVLLDLWYMKTYRVLTFGEVQRAYSEVPVLIGMGLPLLFSNLVSTLLLTVDRQFVNLTFSTGIYAIYAFAYNMLSLVTTATSAISTVIYPTLKKVDPTEYKEKYDFYSIVVLILVGGALSIYFPLCIVIRWFLPKYIDSIQIFRIIFPGLLLSTATQVVMNNFYKVLEKNKAFFIKSVIALVLSILLDVIAYQLWGTTTSISAVSLISMLVWYVISEATLKKEFEIDGKGRLTFIGMLATEFYLCSLYISGMLGFVVYLAAFFATTYLFFHSQIRNFHS